MSDILNFYKMDRILDYDNKILTLVGIFSHSDISSIFPLSFKL